MKYKFLSLGLLALCSVVATTAPQAATSYTITAKHSNKCVSQATNVLTNGAPITQWDCTNTPNFKLEKIPVGSGYFMLKLLHSNKCLTIQGLTTIGKIIQTDCNSLAPAEQTWTELPTTTTALDSYVRIQSTYGTCLNQDGASLLNGGTISTAQCNTQANQLWKFTAAGDCPIASTMTPLQVTGRFLTDSNCNNVMLRGVNLPPYKEGWQNDIAPVSQAVATTKTNAVRLMWWSHIAKTPEPQIGTTFYTAADLDRAITAYSSKGILPIVALHDLTGKNDPVEFNNIVTNFWTRADIVSVIKKHQAHIVINLVNEWGPNWFTNSGVDSKADVTNFINTYKSAISAIRAQGINVPLMIDADQYGGNEKIFIDNSYGQLVSNGQHLIDSDPKHNLLFAVHTYDWKFNYVTNTAGTVDPQSRLTNMVNSKLPFVIGEMGNVLPDGLNFSGYADLLTKANNSGIGYFAWTWYNDSTNTNLAPYRMNITLNGQFLEGDGVTLPTVRSQNPWGWDVLNGVGYGINVVSPATTKILFK